MLPPFAAFLEIPAYYIGIVVPVAALIFAGVIAVCAMYFQNQRRRMWHETTRVALEKGVPLPPNPFDKFGREGADDLPPIARGELGRNDFRSGLILIGVGVGLYLFFEAMGMRPLRFVGAIPGFIGVALVL